MTRLDQTDEEQRLWRWVCAVWDDEVKMWVGSGFLIDEDKVLTCAHVAPGLLTWDTSPEAMKRFKFLFDYFEDANGHLGNTQTAWAREAETLKAARWAASDIGTSNAAPGPDDLDYAIIALKADEGSGEFIGNQPLEDGIARGWLDLATAGDIDTTLQAKLLGVPSGSVMQISEAGRMVRVENAENRFYYTTYSDNGMSGGIAYLVKDGKPIPVALHAGNATFVENANSGAQVPAVHGIPLRAIRAHAEREGGLPDRPAQPQLDRLKIHVIVDIDDEAGEQDAHEDAFVAELKVLMMSSTVTRALSTMRFKPVVAEKPPEEIDASCLTNLADAVSVNVLDRAAKDDVVFFFATAANCENLKQRDRLMSAYGYLTARLGHQRVYLIYPRQLGAVRNLSGGYIGSNDSVLRYNGGIEEIAGSFQAIANTTRTDREDERGFFELAQIALHTIEDRDIFEHPHFNARNTLDILGLRFGTLANKIPAIIHDFLQFKPDGKVTIAFPGRDVWVENPGWLRQLQGGGQDTIDFLTAMHGVVQKGGFEASVLARIRLVAVKEIPTFILTAADIRSTWGKMLIAPAFQHRRDSEAQERNKPRMLVYNKLSQAGIFSAYREALQGLVPCYGGIDEGLSGERGIMSWTLNDLSELGTYIGHLSDARDDIMQERAP